MVSLTSIVMLSFVAVAQLVSSAPSYTPPPPLDICDESQELTKWNTHILTVSKFESSNGNYYMNDTFIGIEKSMQNNNKITTVQTGELAKDQRLLRIDWHAKDDTDRSRIFELKQVKKCRVANSAQYAYIKGAWYVKPIDDE